MLNAIKHAGVILRDNLVLITPVLMFLVIIMLLTSHFIFAGNAVVSYSLAVCIVLFTFAFLSGWFAMIKKAVENSKVPNLTKEQKLKNSNDLFGDFFASIPQNIFYVGIVIIIYFALLACVLFLAQKIAGHFFGDLNFIVDAFKTISTPSATKDFLNSLTTDQLFTLYAWQMTIIGALILFSFLTMYFAPAVMYCTKTPFLAVWNAFKNLFKHFFASLGIFIFLILINTVLQLFFGALNIYTGSNAVIQTITFLVLVIFMVWATVIIFTYYDEKNSGDCGCDSNRQE